MNSLPKKLQEARDNLYDLDRPALERDGFDDGFDSCYQILAPEIEKLVEVLEKFSAPEKEFRDSYVKGNVVIDVLVDTPATDALKKWREFTG